MGGSKSELCFGVFLGNNYTQNQVKIAGHFEHLCRSDLDLGGLSRNLSKNYAQQARDLILPQHSAKKVFFVVQGRTRSQIVIARNNRAITKNKIQNIDYTDRGSHAGAGGGYRNGRESLQKRIPSRLVLRGGGGGGGN